MSAVGVTSLSIAEIQTGERARRDLGDLGPLADSIRELGLLHPIVVTAGGELIAGGRRLAACASLGWEEVPVTVASDIGTATKLLHAERDENTCRLDLSPAEKVALGLRLEELERPLAEARRRDGNARGGSKSPPGQVTGNFPATSAQRPDDRMADRVAVAVGLSRPTYNRAKRIVQAAAAGDPRGKAALAEMEETGKVTGAYRTAFPQSTHPRGGNRERLAKALRPLDHYLKSYSEYNLRGLSPSEARALLKAVQRIDRGLLELERGLETKTIVSRAIH